MLLSAWELVKHRTTKKCPPDSSAQNQTQNLEELVGLQGQVCTTTVSPGKPSTASTAATDSWFGVELLRANLQINGFDKIKSPIFVARYWHLFLDYILTEGKKFKKTKQKNRSRK